jgi:hypothetical protein
MPSPKTRRYSIEIKDPDNKPVLFTAVDWTDEERLIAVAQIMRPSWPAGRQLLHGAGCQV